MMTLAIYVKSLAIAVCAALMATLYFGALSEIQHPSLAGYEMTWVRAGVTLMLTLFASFAIGLPIALLTFLFSSQHLAKSPTALAMVCVLAGIMMVLASFALADQRGVVTLGIPAFIAALTYGILGWFWILKPLRKAERQ